MIPFIARVRGVGHIEQVSEIRIDTLSGPAIHHLGPSSRIFGEVAYEILIFERKNIKIEDRAPLYIVLQKSIYI